MVHRLRSELEGLRRAMRNRAVIEQAKGVLAARFNITPDEAFDQLLELSQRTNTKAAEVAAALVGTAVPDPKHASAGALYNEELRALVAGRRRRATDQAAKPSRPPPPDEVRRLRQTLSPQREALRSQHQFLAGRLASARSYQDILEIIADTMTAWPRPNAMLLTVGDPDGALRTVATLGISAEIRSQWSRIPPQIDIPLVTAYQERKAVLLHEWEITEHFPIARDVAPQVKALACLPLVIGDRLLGAMSISWAEPMRLTGLTRRYLLALGDTIARAVRVQQQGEPDNATTEPGTEPRPEWRFLSIILDQLEDPAAVLTPVMEGDQVIDFDIEHLNPAGQRLWAEHESFDAASSTLLELFPEAGSRLLLGAFTTVLRTGRPYALPDLYISAEQEGPRHSYTFAARATRIGDRVLMVLRRHTDADLLYDQLLTAERVARSGSFLWNLRSGDLRWSPNMYRLFSVDPDRPPIPLGEFAEYVHPDDWLGIQNAVSRLLTGHAAEVEYRLAGQSAGRRIRMRGEPLLDGDEVYAISGTVRDVTEERAAEARLRRAEEALAAQRMRLEAERHAATSIRDAIVPTAPRMAVIPGLVIRGACRTPDGSDDPAGDWYDVLSLADRTVLAIGDVEGTGLHATTAATQLRSALRAYAVLGMPPSEILRALSTMLATVDPDQLATATVATYVPAEQRLVWATAGQAAPVRYSAAGHGSLMDGPLGVPLGTTPDPDYRDAQVRLEPGDRVLMYTDGLLGRRDAVAADGLDVLLHAGAEVDLDDMGSLVEHIIEKLDSLPHDDLCVVTAQVR